MDIPGRIYDFYQHAVKICPFCTMKPRPERSRVSGLRAEEVGDLIFLDHESAKLGDKTFGFLFLLDAVTSHLTAYPCKSTSPSEVISKLHEWMDTFQMNPKAMCADVAFPPSSRHAGILPNAEREENSNKTTYTMAEPSRNGCTAVQEVSLGTRGHSFEESGPDHSSTDHSCSVDSQGGNSEKYPKKPRVVRRLWTCPWDED